MTRISDTPPEIVHLGEEFPMTLQIGLVGRDGVVVASDRCMVIGIAGARQTSLTTKVVVAGDNLFAFAGQDLAELMARYFAERFMAGGAS